MLALFRILYIPSVFIFYLGLLYPFKKSYKRRLSRALEKCGPVFIKAGQSISLKPYIFSPKTVEACSNLQDKVTPQKLNLKKAMGIFYSDFIFESNIPIASGSIACVFKARLKETGELAAVKILKERAEKTIKADIFILKFFSWFLENWRVFKRLKLRSIVFGIEENLKRELNFKLEEENLYIIKANSLKIYEKVRTPRVFTKYTCANLLVTEFITGFPLSNVEAIKYKGLSTYKIAKNLIEIYLEQVYEDGFFHADFHPGNLFINENYQVSLIDFGIVSTISYADRIIIAKILNGFLIKDYDQVLEAHLQGGYITRRENLPAFKVDLEKIGDIFIHSGNKKGTPSVSGILMELFRIMAKYNIEIKEDLLLLYKTIFFVEAVVIKLEPSFNIWEVIKPWMNNWKKRHLGFRARIMKAFTLAHEQIFNFTFKSF